MSSPVRRRPPIEERRAERELFFWTAHKGLRLIIAILLVGYLVVAAIEGKLPEVGPLLRTL